LSHQVQDDTSEINKYSSIVYPLRVIQKAGEWKSLGLTGINNNNEKRVNKNLAAVSEMMVELNSGKWWSRGINR
jgi:hypothetical protein